MEEPLLATLGPSELIRLRLKGQEGLRIKVQFFNQEQLITEIPHFKVIAIADIP